MANDKKNIERIFHILRRTYGSKKRRALKDPLDTLIETVLSQNTSDRNSHGAFLMLKKKFKTWDDARLAKEGVIASTIKSAGLYRIKSRRIKNILQEIYKTHGATDLKFLKKLQPQAARRYLEAFKGVGPKTLSIVMLFSLGRPYFPVDTHILRVCRRLGLIPDKTNAEEAHVLLGELVPKKLMYEFHINLIMHGRTICKAPWPKCGICPLTKLCPWYKEVFIRRR